MKKITEAEFTEALEAVVKERGEDYMYPTKEENPEYWNGGSCRYAVKGEPACIIGAVIAHLGGDVTKIRFQSAAPRDAVREAGLELPDQLSLSTPMDYAQAAQDQGNTWGLALERYREGLEKK